MSDSGISVAAEPVKAKHSKKRKNREISDDEPESRRKKKTCDYSDYWSESEIAELIETVLKQAPKSDETYKCIQPILKWDSIRVGNHSPISCQKKMEFILSKVRRTRSFLELINAAKEINNKGKLLQYPDDMPKKPLGNLFMYFQHRYQKLKAKHPDWPPAKLKKQAQEDLKNLSEKKKAKMRAKYEAELAEYQKAFTEWRKKHPEVKVTGKSRLDPPRITTPLLLFLEDKCERVRNNDHTVSLTELRTKYRKKWKNLKDKKKYKYLNMAVKAKIQYDKELEEYCKLYPDYKPARVHVGFLRHDEWKIKAKLDGLPEAPPRNSFYFFMTEKLQQNPNLDKIMLRAEWRQLSSLEHKSYRKKLKKIHEEYLQKVKQFLDSRDEDEKNVYKDWLDWASMVKTSKSTVRGILNEVLQEDQADSKDDDTKDDKDKKKSKRQRSAVVIAERFPGAPLKPPVSGYHLFCAEVLREKQDIPARERMMLCATEWKKANKKKYSKKLKKLMKKYQKAVEEYVATLPKETAEQFLQYISKTQKKADQSAGCDQESLEDHIVRGTEVAATHELHSPIP